MQPSPCCEPSLGGGGGRQGHGEARGAPLPPWGSSVCGNLPGRALGTRIFLHVHYISTFVLKNEELWEVPKWFSSLRPCFPPRASITCLVRLFLGCGVACLPSAEPALRCGLGGRAARGQGPALGRGLLVTQLLIALKPELRRGPFSAARPAGPALSPACRLPPQRGSLSPPTPPRLRLPPVPTQLCLQGEHPQVQPAPEDQEGIGLAHLCSYGADPGLFFQDRKRQEQLGRERP